MSENEEKRNNGKPKKLSNYMPDTVNIDVEKAFQNVMYSIRKTITVMYPDLDFVTKKDYQVLAENPLFTSLVMQAMAMSFIWSSGTSKFFDDFIKECIPRLHKEGIQVELDEKE